MAETIYEAAKRSQNPYTVEAFLAIATSDELFSVLPWVAKDGESFGYTREKSLGSFGFVADGHTTVTESTGSDEVVTVAKREAVADFYIRNFAQANLAGRISPADRETMRKFKAAGQTLSDKIINGGFVTGITVGAFPGGAGVDALVSSSGFMDSNRQGPGSLKYTNTGTLLQFRAPGDVAYGPTVDISGGDGNYTLVSDNPSKWITVTLDVTDFSADAERVVYFTSTTNEFDGLKTLMSSGQVRTASGANGDAYSFGILDDLITSVKLRQNRVFIMPSSLLNMHLALERGRGYQTAYNLPNTDLEVPRYRNIPILTNDFIAENEAKGSATTLSSVYLVSLTAEEGFWMGALGGETFDVEADPRDATVLGFRLEELGQIQGGPSAFGRRLMFFGGAALGSDKAAARASQLITTSL